jgi:wyosine [tRNA(Phe)-imidazoG37] synthetase (radical SAM superfamily)
MAERTQSLYVFGPVPSRRLGRSLGINNIPPKACSYSCVYCQLGRTIDMQVRRCAFYRQQAVIEPVRERVGWLREKGESVDYLTFVPDGEPTLDSNLGREVEMLRSLGVPIAVISNGSLVWHDDVRQDLARMDWVSLKIDSTREEIWKKVDRPHGSLELGRILEGMQAFADSFPGRLVTETMLVQGLNDDAGHLEEVARFLAKLNPAASYLAVPTRPPAESWVAPPKEESLHRAYQIFRQHVGQVEFLIGYEGNAFSATGDTEQDLLSITAVHPMREDAVEALLRREGDEWRTVRRLVQEGKLVKSTYEGMSFYMRRLR